MKYDLNRQPEHIYLPLFEKEKNNNEFHSDYAEGLLHGQREENHVCQAWFVSHG